jgi:hypothetical protein
MIWGRGCRIKIRGSLVRRILLRFRRNIRIRFGLWFRIILLRFIRRWRMEGMKRRKMRIRSDYIYS